LFVVHCTLEDEEEERTGSLRSLGLVPGNSGFIRRNLKGVLQVTQQSVGLKRRDLSLGSEEKRYHIFKSRKLTLAYSLSLCIYIYIIYTCVCVIYPFTTLVNYLLKEIFIYEPEELVKEDFFFLSSTRNVTEKCIMFFSLPSGERRSFLSKKVRLNEITLT